MGQPMLEPSTLLNAQLGFLPILCLLLHSNRRDDDATPLEPSKPWHFWHPFVNVSINSSECSIVCPRELAETLFMPLLEHLSSEVRQRVTLSEEDYSAILIGGEGLEAGQRVLDLTTPLALAGIPIFFITSYYSDFILVPHSSRAGVIHALEDRGFVFEASGEDGEAGQMTNSASPLLYPKQRSSSFFPSLNEFPLPVTTPPPADATELQAKTFKLLARNNIIPQVDNSIELVTCAGVKANVRAASAAHFYEGKLQLGITRCLTSYPPPRFFSITLTDTESASLTLDKTLLDHFPQGGEDVLLGMQGPEQIPVTLDLRNLPLESTGIVCGVASRLTEGMRGRIGREMFNMSYLSTARAGHVIVYEDELDDVLDALKGVQVHNL